MARFGLAAVLLIGVAAVVADLCPEPVSPDFLLLSLKECTQWLRSTSNCVPTIFIEFNLATNKEKKYLLPQN